MFSKLATRINAKKKQNDSDSKSSSIPRPRKGSKLQSPIVGVRTPTTSRTVTGKKTPASKNKAVEEIVTPTEAKRSASKTSVSSKSSYTIFSCDSWEKRLSKSRKVHPSTSTLISSSASSSPSKPNRLRHSRSSTSTKTFVIASFDQDPEGNVFPKCSNVGDSDSEELDSISPPGSLYSFYTGDYPDLPIDLNLDFDVDQGNEPKDQDQDPDVDAVEGNSRFSSKSCENESQSMSLSNSGTTMQKDLESKCARRGGLIKQKAKFSGTKESDLRKATKSESETVPKKKIQFVIRVRNSLFPIFKRFQHQPQPKFNDNDFWPNN